MPVPIAAIRGSKGSIQSSGPAPQAATGYLQFAGNPVDGDTLLALNGFTGIVFKDAPAGWPEILIAEEGNLSATLGHLLDGLTEHENDPGNEALAGATYSTDGVDKLIITFDTPGVEGNSYTLGADTANITRSGPTLTGGA